MVPAVGEAWFLKRDPLWTCCQATERGRPDGYLSFSERLAQGGPSRPTKRTAGLRRSPPLLFIHFCPRSVRFHLSRSSVPCFVLFSQHVVPPPLPPAELTCIFIIWACTTLTCVFFYLLILHKPLARLSFSFQLCRGMPHAGFHTKAAEGVSGSSLIQQRGNIFHSGGFKHAVAVVKTWAI